MTTSGQQQLPPATDAIGLLAQFAERFEDQALRFSLSVITHNGTGRTTGKIGEAATVDFRQLIELASQQPDQKIRPAHGTPDRTRLCLRGSSAPSHCLANRTVSRSPLRAG